MLLFAEQIKYFLIVKLTSDLSRLYELELDFFIFKFYLYFHLYFFLHFLFDCFQPASGDQGNDRS